MRINFEILESDDQIQKQILKALKVEFNKRIRRSPGKVLSAVQAVIEDAIKSQPEYQALDNGKLSLEFGLTNGKERIDAVITQIIESIKITALPTSVSNKKIRGGIQIVGIPSDYGNLIRLPEASITTQKGTELYWLEWLLMNGDQGFILDYDIVYTPTKVGRTKRAVMVRKAGARWGVPPEFAGTKENNFITRAIDKIEDDIAQAISRAI